MEVAVGGVVIVDVDVVPGVANVAVVDTAAANGPS